MLWTSDLIYTNKWFDFISNDDANPAAADDDDDDDGGGEMMMMMMMILMVVMIMMIMIRTMIRGFNNDVITNDKDDIDNNE